MKRRSVSTMLGAWLLTAAMVCSQIFARGNQAQGNKPEPVAMQLNVGDVAPDFKLHYFDGSDLKEVTLSQYRGKSNVVLAFYVFAFTGG
ncbi:MAG TPA: redoxin domain-containing protein [Terriglobales bacterium]|nr:redoxin domain-containing protein [Terriglobales bacterium]